MIFWLVACQSTGVVFGEGERAGMVFVPGGQARGGDAVGMTRPKMIKKKSGGVAPPPKPPAPGPPGDFHEPETPDFVCSKDEVAQDRCPGLYHYPLPTQVVTVSPFWIDALEVTRAQYGAFLADTGYRPPHVEEPWAEEEWNWDGPTPPVGTENHPVVLTNWYDAREYCAWRGARLPTEAEWQIATHGPVGSETAYPWGDVYEEGRMNRGRMELPSYDDADGFRTTSPVGHYPGGVSRYGANDLFGNAWEWVADIRMRSWSEVRFADEATLRDPQTTTLGLYAGSRGFAYFADPRPMLGIGHNAFPVELRRKTTGFRCAVSD